MAEIMKSNKQFKFFKLSKNNEFPKFDWGIPKSAVIKKRLRAVVSA